MEVIERWAWTVGLAAGVLGVGAGLAWIVEGSEGPAADLGLWALGLAAITLLIRRDAVLAWLRLPSTVRLAGALLATALTLALSVGLVGLADRYEQTLDLTQSGRNTLSDQSVAVLEGLPASVTATVFATARSPGRDEVLRLLALADDQTPRLEVEVVDPIAAPARAREAGITGEHAIVMLQVAGRPPVRLDGALSEDDLVSGVVEATSEVLHRVCWTVDHGEADPDDETSAAGLGGVRTALERLNYQVTLSRLVVDGLDPDCEVVVVARPVLELSDEVIATLDRYVRAGGQLLILLEPGGGDALAGWLRRYGIDTDPRTILQPRSRDQLAGADPTALWLPSGGLHPITADLAGFAFVGARPVLPDQRVEGVEVDGLVWTADDARLGDRDGPFAVMALARVQEPRQLGPLTRDAPPATLRAGGRIVLVGDADFATRRFAQLANNTDLFLNTIAWLVREPAQVGERRPTAETLRLTGAGLTLHGVLFVLVWPLLGVLGAVGVYLSRRER